MTIPQVMAKHVTPTVLSQLVILLYNLADTFFVGNTNNPSQVAALTISFPLFMTMTLIANLFGIGANSLMARSLGAGDRDQAERASTFAFYASLGLMAVWMLVLVAFMHPILVTIGAITEETYAATRAYMCWTLIAGGFPTVAAMMLGHLSRGEGKTKRASVGMAVGGLLNIALDPVFVQGMGMGAAGAGFATFLSNCVGTIYLLTCVLRDPESVIRLSPRGFSFDGALAREVALVGLPAAAVILLGCTANVVLTHCMAAYGDISVAAFGVVQKIGTVTIQITVGLTQGLMPLLGWCYGARDMVRLRVITRLSIIMLAIYAIACVIVLELVPTQAILLFIQEGKTVELGTAFMRRWILCAFGMCFTMLLNSIFQAMGKWFQSLALTVFRQGIMLIPLLIVLNQTMGMYGLVWSQPIADTASLGVGFAMYAWEMRGRSRQGH